MSWAQRHDRGIRDAEEKGQHTALEDEPDPEPVSFQMS